MITINTNVNNLKLQRNLNTVNSAMQNALNRISTGYRINNASDDAAGLVISKALDVQNRGLNVANQNAQMATNLLSVADGALGQMGELTMRIRDLATQSANGGYSDIERKALSLEAKELTNNLEQLVKGTKFNDYNIFEGSGSGSAKEITTEAEAIAQGFEIVKTAEQLKAVLTAPDALDTGKKVMLFGDINLDELGIVDGNNWEVVGTDVSVFKGTFDGNGYTISNLKINKPTTDYQGFFGYTEGATIKNTSLENVDVKGARYTGGFVGRLGTLSTIQNSHSTGNVVGAELTGGLVGRLGTSSVVQNSSSTANVEGTNYVGGLAGRLATTSVLENSYSTGNAVGIDYVGGLAGYLSNASIVQNSYSTGNATGADHTGGLIGGMTNAGASIKNSYATGDVFSTSAATSSSDFGGLVGRISEDALISNSYCTGQNKATVGYRGGFIGEISSGFTLTLDNYAYATQTESGVANGNGVGMNKGTISGTEQTSGQNEAFFNTSSNIKNILDVGTGGNQWDYTTLPPKLAWQKARSPITFQIGTDGSGLSAISMDLGFDLNGFKPDFSSAMGSRKTMEQCDNLLKQINTKRGEIGANTNIISSIVDGNTITNENLTASKSRIQDADIAKESAIMVKNQILEQATSSLLSQSSNLSGQLALQLLSGLGGRR